MILPVKIKNHLGFYTRTSWRERATPFQHLSLDGFAMRAWERFAPPDSEVSKTPNFGIRYV